MAEDWIKEIVVKKKAAEEVASGRVAQEEAEAAARRRGTFDQQVDELWSRIADAFATAVEQYNTEMGDQIVQISTDPPGTITISKTRYPAGYLDLMLDRDSEAAHGTMRFVGRDGRSTQQVVGFRFEVGRAGLHIAQHGRISETDLARRILTTYFSQI